MAPFDLTQLAGTIPYALIFFAIGAGFGAVLEMSGFGDSRKLAAQFYFREMTVLKVMFTGIVVAATLIFLAAALGLLDYERVWVNPTYLAPGIVGGLIMGVGFIIGGFCPGTSLVAASTLKLDGIAFVLGVGAGIFAFGESVQGFEGFFLSTFMGRFTLADWLHVPYGVVLLGLVLMALAMFYAAEISEAYFGRGERGSSLLSLRSRAKLLGAACLIAAAGTTALLGQPTLEDRWKTLPDGENALTTRSIYVDPAEYADLTRDLSLFVRTLDFRPESEFNLFHLRHAERMEVDDLRKPEVARALKGLSDNTVLFLVSNDERDATRAYKLLRAQNVLNVYVLEGGINNWLRRFPLPASLAEQREGAHEEDAPAFRFAYALGDGYATAHPDSARRDPMPSGVRDQTEKTSVHTAPPAAYTKKVKIRKKVAAKGGCG